MSGYLRMTAFVEIESKWFGFGINDATAGLKLEGGLDFSSDITVDGELRFVTPFLWVHSNLIFIFKEILEINAFHAA